MPLLDGYKIADEILQKTKRKVTLLRKKGITPHLGVVFVGSDDRSAVYIRKKGEAAKEIGMDFSLYQFPATISEKKLIQEIHSLQQKSLTGLIVQLPLPDHLYTPHILNAINPKIDVDCLTHENLGKLIMKWGELCPPTPGACLDIIKTVEKNLIGKNVVILGAGTLVGKPLSLMLMNERATVQVCNSKTKDLKKICKAADIIVTGVGKKDLIRGNMVKKGAVVVDAGICFEKGKIYGDVNVAEVSKKAHVTPTPGGVGPITVAKLLWNTAECAENLLKK